MKKFLKKRAFLLAVAASLLLIPETGHAGIGDIVSLFSAITGTLQGAIGQALGEIQALRISVENLEQQVVWPLAVINQTKAFAAQVRAQWATLAGEIHSIEVQSATLVNPAHFESVLRSGQASTLTQVQPAFTKLYRPVSDEGEAALAERNLMDVDDAMAEGALKTAIVSDQASRQMFRMADSLEQQTSATAPGTATFLTAQAQVANLENQALLQRMLAAELRQEAAALAHGNALRKRSAEAVKGLGGHLQQVLNKP